MFHENDDEYIPDDIQDAWSNLIDPIGSVGYLREEYNSIIESPQFRDAVEFLHPI